MAAVIGADRSSWLEWRRHGIGGSDAAAIAGLSPWKTPYMVWLEKTGQLVGEQEESEVMRWGTLLEPVIANEFEQRTGLVVTDRQRQVEAPDEPWRRCTLDGSVAESVAVEDADARRLVHLGAYEGKTTSAIRHALDWSAGVPDHYQLQVQHNLAVTGDVRAWVTCLVGGQRLAIEEVGRDQGVINELLEIEREFWWRVQKMRPPAVDGGVRTGEAIRAAFRQPEPGRAIELPDELRLYVADLLDAKAQKKRLEARIQEDQNILMAALGDAESALSLGREVLSWKAYEQRRLDEKALRAAEPEIVEKYTRVAALRRFLVKEKEVA